MKSETLEFFEARKGQIFSAKDVSKELDERRYQKDKTWASGELKSLWSKGFIQAINGCYWIPEEGDKEEDQEGADPGGLAQAKAPDSESQPPEKL